MSKIKVGIIREGKVPPDKRVALTPHQCVEVMEKFSSVEIVVQPSNVRAFKDEEYLNLGVKMAEDLSDCDILIGIKEVNKPDLIPSKKYLFFSHTFKKQLHNRELLKKILELKIQLIDYEVLKDTEGARIIGFGRYAGIVGTYSGFLAYGKKHGLYELTPAHQCDDRKMLENELKKVVLPATTKIVLTGFGRVGHGAREILANLGLKEVEPAAFLTETFNEPVFTQLEVEEYYAKEDGTTFDKSAFFNSGKGHISTFSRYLNVADLYIACHYWNATSPVIISQADLVSPHRKTTVISDISCDVDGPIASTIRSSTIANPLYGYDPINNCEIDFMDPKAIGIQAVDNLPCELPKDASEDFGNELIDKVFQSLFEDDKDRIIERASQTNLKGELTSAFAYLQGFVDGTE